MKKTDKAPFFIHADLIKKRIKKIDVCKSHPENSSTAKEGEHTPLAFPMSTILSFKSIENKHDIYRSKNCMKKFCQSLRKHEMKIITDKLNRQSYWEMNSRTRIQKSAIFVKKKLTINMLLIKNIIKLETIVIIQGNIECQQISISISICNLQLVYVI